jgi:short-subunit dehydrogenase
MPNHRAIVTGASRGIGRAIALRLARDYEIIAVARSGDELESLAEEIEEAGGLCRPRAVDVTDPEAVRFALADIEPRVLVNNAGLGVIKPFMDLTREEWTRMVNLNLNSLYDVTRAVIPGMIRRNAGHIVFIGSISARSAYAGGTGYTATKAAVNAFSESLMLELREHGVKVSVVNPGGVNTTFNGEAAGSEGSWKLAPEDVAEAVANVIDTPPNVLVHRVEVRTLTPPPRKN